MIDFVIPTCARDAAQAQILLRSLEANVASDAIGSVVLVSVDEPGFHAQMRTLETPGLRSRLEYVTPGDLGVSAETLAKDRGWLVQQVAKLIFARRARGEFYMVLDSKNIVLRPVGLAELVREGRAPWVLEDVSHHRRWWNGSARLLRHRKFDRRSPRRALSAATPVLLHAPTVRNLMDWVEKTYAAPFDRAFLRRPIFPWMGRATEFCTYFTYLDRERQLDAHHFEAPWLHDASVQIWSEQPAEMRQERLTRLLEEEPAGLFTGIQSPVWRAMDDGLRARITARATGEVKTLRPRTARG